MIRFVSTLIFLVLLITPAHTYAQDTIKNITPDTGARIRTVPPEITPSIQDTVIMDLNAISAKPKDTGYAFLNLRLIDIKQFRALPYISNPYFGYNAPSIKSYIIKKEWQGKEILFYSLLLLLFFFAFYRQAFYKYLSDLTGLFFKSTVKQRQLREQLLQTPLASLLLNLFFVISTSFYINFVLEYYHIMPVNNFWLLLLYVSGFLLIIYLGKFIWLKLAGWIFNLRDATDSYIFIVFVMNKIIGIFLLPFLILLAFSTGTVYEVAFILSVIGVAGMLGYRFVLTYMAVRNHIKLNLFHFFLYLCAFEIIPLLLIYKVLLIIFERYS